ncbi:hypothetical protein BC936DRAFT_146813 [Jimgerdemannia flammicorona]|uniref:Uncharacterized protein n=2 Tax=Jimgerdemannia flammicorona TaxID=994334 RepID=A0A433D6R1_9FUNG|nr:hypothetical protein BC936DRAFT_146813 [Jimgerdemannia flammicorona]RUS34878.1 hypothetical protein BC938DRAFT_478042 [Jimgerdemannia flammicorona]
MSSNPSIPQFVVIKDHTAQSHRHPVVHYVFEDEELDGGVPKDGCIVVDLSDTCSEVVGADSYSPLFQVTECRVEAVASSTAALSTNMGGETTDMMMLTIEGISVEECVPTVSIFVCTIESL